MKISLYFHKKRIRIRISPPSFNIDLPIVLALVFSQPSLVILHIIHHISDRRTLVVVHEVSDETPGTVVTRPRSVISFTYLQTALCQSVTFQLRFKDKWLVSSDGSPVPGEVSCLKRHITKSYRV